MNYVFLQCKTAFIRNTKFIFSSTGRLKLTEFTANEARKTALYKLLCNSFTELELKMQKKTCNDLWNKKLEKTDH